MQSAFKQFTIDPLVPFGYSFTFYQGSPGTQIPVDLTEASGLLTVKDAQNITLMTLSSSVDSDEYPSPAMFPGPQLPSSGDENAANIPSPLRFPGSTQFPVSDAKAGTGIYFGGTSVDPTNGIIGLMISSEDIDLIDWQYANYNLVLTTEIFGRQNLLRGSFAVVGFLP
jgi:hypothetical protein